MNVSLISKSLTDLMLLTAIKVLQSVWTDKNESSSSHSVTRSAAVDMKVQNGSLNGAEEDLKMPIESFQVNDS